MEIKKVEHPEVKMLANAMEKEELELYRDAFCTAFIGYQKAILAFKTQEAGFKPEVIQNQVQHLELFMNYFWLYSMAILCKLRMKRGQKEP